MQRNATRLGRMGRQALPYPEVVHDRPSPRDDAGLGNAPMPISKVLHQTQPAPSQGLRGRTTQRVRRHGRTSEGWVLLAGERRASGMSDSAVVWGIQSLCVGFGLPIKGTFVFEHTWVPSVQREVMGHANHRNGMGAPEEWTL